MKRYCGNGLHSSYWPEGDVQGVLGTIQACTGPCCWSWILLAVIVNGDWHVQVLKTTWYKNWSSKLWRDIEHNNLDKMFLLNSCNLTKIILPRLWYLGFFYHVDSSFSRNKMKDKWCKNEKKCCHVSVLPARHSISKLCSAFKISGREAQRDNKSFQTIYQRLENNPWSHDKLCRGLLFNFCN